MQKLGPWVPDGPQAPEAIRSLGFRSLQDQTLAFWSHGAGASVDFTEWFEGGNLRQCQAVFRAKEKAIRRCNHLSIKSEGPLYGLGVFGCC